MGFLLWLEIHLLALSGRKSQNSLHQELFQVHLIIQLLNTEKLMVQFSVINLSNMLTKTLCMTNALKLQICSIKLEELLKNSNVTSNHFLEFLKEEEENPNTMFKKHHFSLMISQPHQLVITISKLKGK